MAGVSNKNVSITTVMSDNSGITLVLKNNGSEAVTPGSVNVMYFY